MNSRSVWLVLSTTIAIFCTACSSTPVAVSCPPPPRLPDEVRSAAISALTEEPSTKDYEATLVAEQNDLQRTLLLAHVPPKCSAPASTTTTESGR